MGKRLIPVKSSQAISNKKDCSIRGRFPVYYSFFMILKLFVPSFFFSEKKEAKLDQNFNTYYSFFVFSSCIILSAIASTSSPLNFMR